MGWTIVLAVPIKRIAKIFIIGLLLLLFGGNVLSSLTYVVLAFRMGNAAPAILVIMSTVIFVWIEGHVHTDHKIQRLLNLLSTILIGFSTATVFFIGLGGGILIAGVSALLFILVSFLVNDTSRLAMFLDVYGRKKGHRSNGAEYTTSFLISNSPEIDLVLAPPDNFALLLQVIRTRPMLPLTLVVGVDFVALLMLREFSIRVRQLMETSNIEFNDAPPLLQQAILSIPLILTEQVSTVYSVVTDDDAINSLLGAPMPGMIVSYTTTSLVIAVPSDHTFGMLVQQVPPRHVASALRRNNLSLLVMQDV